MLYEDYLKLLEAVKDLDPKKYIVQSSETYKEYNVDVYKRQPVELNRRIE